MGQGGLLRCLPTSLGEHTPKLKPGPEGWGLGMRLTTSSWKLIMLRSPKKDYSDYRKGPCKQRKDMNLVMWNILSLNRNGVFKKLEDELHKVQSCYSKQQDRTSDDVGVKFFILVTLQYAIVVTKSSHCLEQDL
jgi:hypothetical protein